MSQATQNGKLIALLVLVVAAFLGLGYRLVDLQVINRVEHERIGQNNSERTFLKQPRRGDIRSSRGDLLATSVPVYTVFIDPTQLQGRQREMAQVLAPLLKLDPTSLLARIQPRITGYRTNERGKVTPKFDQYEVLKRKVRVEEWEKIQAALKNAAFGLNPAPRPKSREEDLLKALRTKAVGVQEDAIRFYPNGRLAAHVIGYTAEEDAKAGMKGKDGSEWNLNDQLTGVGGWRETERDGDGNEMVVYRRQDVEARDGHNVYLTIDTVLQQILESELNKAMDKWQPKSITGVIVRPRTGEILALANLPTFDPNLPGKSTDDQRRNRVIADIVEPGSTFKSVVVASALSDKTVTLRDVFDCERGVFYFAKEKLHDHDPYGLLTVEQIITKSSNIGAAKIGIKMGDQRLYQHLREFGFGSRTGIPLPGEVIGIVNSVKNWSKVTIAQIPMGHGVAVTRLQMTMAIAAIANNGTLMRPMLVDRVEDAQGRLVAKYSAQAVRQVVSPEGAKLAVQALKTVTTKDGTAPKAALEHYTVAGKTGTAQKFRPAAEGGGYYDNRFVSSFIGFLPADDPEICISIVLDEPPAAQHYGGTCAAPVFRDVAERAASYLNLVPDIGEPASLSSTAPVAGAATGVRPPRLTSNP